MSYVLPCLQFLALQPEMWNLKDGVTTETRNLYGWGCHGGMADPVIWSEKQKNSEGTPAGEEEGTNNTKVVW